MFNHGFVHFMIYLLLFAFVILVIIWVHYFTLPLKPSYWMPCAISIFIMIASGTIYLSLGHLEQLISTGHSTSAMSDSDGKKTAKEVNREQVEKMQKKVLEDKQNGGSWYALGNAYMYNNEFEHAATAFLYAERLATEPQANIYAARATALYYDNNQRFDSTIERLVDKAQSIDPDNVPTLMLIASNHFLNAEYQDAINTWQHALDTGHADVDRVAIINAINQAKQFIQ